MADLPPDALVAGSMMLLLPLVLRLLSHFTDCRFCTCRLSFRLLLETLGLKCGRGRNSARCRTCSVQHWQSSFLFHIFSLSLFDYEKDGLPPELVNLKPEEFLAEPDKPNLVFLPKKDLARICEMLSPKDFLALSQTCRLLHWRMMKFCHCSVENLDVYIRPEGRRSNGNPIHRIYPKMALNLHRKQLLFHNVHLYYVIPTDLNLYLKKVISMVGGRKNVKRLEITFIVPASLLGLTSVLRAMAASYIHVEDYDPSNLQRDVRYHKYTSEVRGLHRLTEGSCAREKEVIVRSPKGLYLNVPPVIIDKILKLFLGPEQHGILEYTCLFPAEDHQEVYSGVEKHWKRALERAGVRMRSEKVDDFEAFLFTFPGERYQLVRIYSRAVFLRASTVPFAEGTY